MTLLHIDQASFNVSAPLWAAVLILFGAIFTGWVALHNQRRSTFIDTVTKERAQWRSEVRQNAAALLAQVTLAISNDADERARFSASKFQVSKTALLLRLNPKGRTGTPEEKLRHALDRKITVELRCLREIPFMDREAWLLPETKRCIRMHSDELENAIQELIKREWQVSKFEARKGRIFDETTDRLD